MAVVHREDGGAAGMLGRRVVGAVGEMGAGEGALLGGARCLHGVLLSCTPAGERLAARVLASVRVFLTGSSPKKNGSHLT